MKKTIYLVALLLSGGIAFSTPKLPDGIYLIDASTNYKHAAISSNRAVIQFSPAFVEEDPDSYTPLVICTDNYVPFELAKRPVIDYHVKDQAMLKVHLTDQATEQLKIFTSKNLSKQMVVVINGEALSVYNITHAVKSSIIDVANGSGASCRIISRELARQLAN